MQGTYYWRKIYLTYFIALVYINPMILSRGNSSKAEIDAVPHTELDTCLLAETARINTCSYFGFDYSDSGSGIFFANMHNVKDEDKAEAKVAIFRGVLKSMKLIWGNCGSVLLCEGASLCWNFFIKWSHYCRL
jgi:hypothetical protein